MWLFHSTSQIARHVAGLQFRLEKVRPRYDGMPVYRAFLGVVVVELACTVPNLISDS
jgi:hypothetical protein